MLDDAMTARPKSGRHAVCSIRRALAALHDLLFCHWFPTDRVVAIDANGDPAVAIANAEKDALAGSEASEFEHRVVICIHGKATRLRLSCNVSEGAACSRTTEIRVHSSARVRRGLRLALAMSSSLVELVVVSGP